MHIDQDSGPRKKLCDWYWSGAKGVPNEPNARMEASQPWLPCQRWPPLLFTGTWSTIWTNLHRWGHDGVWGGFWEWGGWRKCTNNILYKEWKTSWEEGEDVCTYHRPLPSNRYSDIHVSYINAEHLSNPTSHSYPHAIYITPILWITLHKCLHLMLQD